MKLIVKSLFKIIILSLIITLFASITPLSVSASNFPPPCSTISLAPVDGVYDMLPRYDANGDLSADRECINNFTKKSAKQNIEPSITVLTHGLGGDPSHWSNDNVTQVISYDTDSIIEKIRGLDVGNTEVFMIENEIPGQTKNSFKIVKLNIDSLTSSYSPQEVDFSSTALSKKVVVIYKASDKKQHNITDYLELDYIIDFFSYKYYLDYHYIPKVNLIGQSRGGLSNLQYLNEHPYNVDSIFSIDTPFFGSEFGQMTALMNLIKLSDTINSCGGQDILDTGIDIIDSNACDIPLMASESGSGTLHQKYLDDFEEAKVMNDQIKAYAIGSAVTLEFFLKFLGDELANFLIDNNIVTEDNRLALEDFLDEQADLLEDVYTAVQILQFDLTTYKNAFQNVLQLTCPLNITPEMTDICETLEETPYLNILDNLILTLGDSGLPEVDYHIYNSSGNLLQNILLDDIFVHTNSQLGRTLTQSYDFETFLKVYNSAGIESLQSKLLVIKQPAVPHNLSARDPDIINFIVGEIKGTTVTTTINVNDYSATLVSTQTDYNDIVIPALDPITGYPIKNISETSFVSESSVKSIYIPSTVTSIHANAFINLPNLTSIEVDPENPIYYSNDGILMSRSSNAVFAYPRGRNPLLETTLLGIDLSNSDDNALILPGIVDSIYIPANYTALDEYNFNQYPNLNEIKVNPANPTYKVVNDMLINKQKNTVIAYPRAKVPASSPLEVPSDITDIGEQAFKDNINLSTVNISNVVRIHENAFQGSSVTSIIGNNQLMSVSQNAFASTPLYDISTIVIIEGVLIKYSEPPVNGIINLTEYSTGKSEDQQIKIINEFAFPANPSLVELRLPASILRIDNYGLANLVNLKRLYIPSLVDVRLSSSSLANLNGSLTIYTSSNAALTSEKLTPDIFTNITIVETTDTNIVDKVSRWVYIQPYSNAYIYPTPLNGYVFEYWAEVTPDNVIPVTDQNGFVTDLAYQFEGTLFAFYSPLVYEMNLTVDGVLLESFHYTIESSTPLPVAYKTQSVFVGWNCAGQLIVSIVPGRTGNYDCSAVFNPTTLYAITTPGSYAVVAANATVNLVNSISSTQSLTITIASSTNYVEVKGVAYQIYNNTKIIISTRTTPLMMVFNNLILLAPVGNTLMTNSSYSPTYITTYGYVYLKGGDGSLSSVSNGLDGKPAITMSGPLYLYTYKGSISLIGGNGSTGITGQSGTNGVDGVNGTLFANGTNGSDGSNGQIGLQGGDGAVAVSTSIFTVKSFNSTIHLIGGSGGRGGTGGSGGHGGDGGDGYSNWLYSTSAGHGGDGGNGGQGGLGGLGANPMVAPQGCYLIDATGSTFIVQEGTTGLTGLVGYKGLGGDGGDGMIPGIDGNDGSGR